MLPHFSAVRIIFLVDIMEAEADESPRITVFILIIEILKCKELMVNKQNFEMYI